MQQGRIPIVDGFMVRSFYGKKTRSGKNKLQMNMYQKMIQRSRRTSKYMLLSKVKISLVSFRKGCQVGPR